MVIFGAGASYDSSPDFVPNAALGMDGGGGPWRPPLANSLFLDQGRLFGEIVVKYPRLTHVLPYLRTPSAGKSVEQILESLQNEGKNCPERLRELAAVKFYLCDFLMRVTDEWTARTNGVTNYAPLIAEILRLDNSDEEVCLVTFNYDLLLERALVSFRDFNMKGPEDFLSSHPRLKIFKLHGSVNWSRTIGTGELYSPSQLIEQADSLRPSDRFVQANAAREYGAWRPYGSVFPAIAIPVQTKTENHFECPLAHREHLKAMLPNITKILIIGWQAREAHFLQMLCGNLPKLKRVMVVGAHKPDAHGTLKWFLEQIHLPFDPKSPNYSVAQSGFTHFIVNHEGDGFLSS